MARTARVCNKSGCVEIVTGNNYCDEHKKPAWQGSTWQQTRPANWRTLRASILKRDHHTCTYCGGKATEVDHVIPVSKGGTHKATNLVASCTPCNQRKNIEQRGTPST